MRKPTIASIAAVALVVALTPAPAVAGRAHPYSLVDVGTFGGPQAFLDLPGRPITPSGAVLGTADTTIPDRDFPNFNPFMVGFPDPTLVHAFSWRDGRLHDLGALPGNNSSAVFEVNRRGVGAGMSESGGIDPYTGWPVEHATVFERRRVRDLGHLSGGYESQALAIDDRGQVAGFAQNGVPDPASMLGWGTQTRSFAWNDGRLRDLGTLGGPDALMSAQNARGQIAGDSYTNATADPATGAPTTHPFLWTDGHMRDLGTLGGAQSATSWLNDAGEVVGGTSLAGEQAFHPYLWDGAHLRDLGTFGGTFGIANYVNEAGHVAGFASLPGDATGHAFLWRHGSMTDLSGAGSPECTLAEALNDRDWAVGETCDEQEALLWVDGRQYDLAALAGSSDVQLTEAVAIDDRGTIVSVGRLPNGDQHVFVLRPSRGGLPAASGGHDGHRWGVRRIVGRLRRPLLR